MTSLRQLPRDFCKVRLISEFQFGKGLVQSPFSPAHSNFLLLPITLPCQSPHPHSSTLPPHPHFLGSKPYTINLILTWIISFQDTASWRLFCRFGLRLVPTLKRQGTPLPTYSWYQTLQHKVPNSLNNVLKLCILHQGSILLWQWSIYSPLSFPLTQRT